MKTSGNLLNIDLILKEIKREMVHLSPCEDFLVVNEMAQVGSELLAVSQIDCPILFLGETGVGKSYFAKKSHAQSPRSNRPFVDINAATIPEALFESLFFGHLQGSFTDATTNHSGYLSLADEGTLFIDEVADLPLAIQAKLLKVLDDKAFWPIGSDKPSDCNVRFIFATNKDIQKMVRDGLFREDLYYRIACVPITIPPIRFRGSESIFLFLKFFSEYARHYQKSVPELSKGAYGLIEQYKWPGNIRQLKFCAQRAAIVVKSHILSQSDIALPKEVYVSERVQNGLESLADLSLPQAIEEIEKLVITRKLLQYKSLSRVARECDISRQTLRSKCRSYKLTA